MSKYYPPVTVTGNPVNFSAPNGGKLDSVSVQIIPTQDLHGYANPWPAGGGVNKFGGSINTLFPLSLQSGTVIIASADLGGASYGVLRTYDSSETFLQSVLIQSNFGSRHYAALTLSSDISYVKVEGNTLTDIQVEIAPNASALPSPYSPYSNICPISGRTGVSVYVSPTQDQQDATTYAVDWTSEAGTVYGGTVDVVSGELTVDMVNIPSYNGETITEPWLSSMDAYTAGTTPTIGAQVVYTLATPVTYQLTPKQIAALIDQNYIWSSNNETISVVYALLVPVSDKYTLIVNGVDIADFVERDSYRTTLYPVFSEAVQTLDGVGHTALLRKKGELSARFNPRTAADTAIICAALLNAPCEVQYHCLQRNADVTALMTIDSVSALYLSRCLYCRQKWNDIDSITLTEL